MSHLARLNIEIMCEIEQQKETYNIIKIMNKKKRKL